MSITRSNKYLGEIIQILDMHRAKYRAGDIGDDEARASLSSADNDWVDGEVYHCLIDARYFLSNYYAIRTEDKGFQGLYPFFDSQEILYEELRKMEKRDGRVRAMVSKARRMGYTTYMIGEFLHKTALLYKHTDAIIVSQDEKGAKYNMGMYESALDFLPWWMKPRINLHQTGALYNFDEPDENIRARRPGLKNWIYADNANRPSGVGRGQGFRCGVLDELAFWKNSSQLSKSLLRTFVARDGFYVMGSTGNGRNDSWHNLWRRAESGSIDWHPIFIPFYRRPKTYSLPLSPGEVFVLSPEEKEMVEQVKKNTGFEISKETINWMRKTKEEFIATDGDDMLFGQEFPMVAEDAFQNSIISAIPRGIINRYSKRTVQPKWVGEISFDFNKWEPRLHMRELNKGEEALYPETEDRLHIWEKRQTGERYCIGVDVALGQKGADYSSCTVMKISSNAQLDEEVAQWHGYMDPHNLTDIVLALGWYYNEALVAIEVNGFGMATNTRLMREYEYENIYRFKRMDRLKHFMTDIVGWWTDYKSKRTLISFLSKMMLDDQVIIRDKYLIDELRDFTEYGAEGEGAHDDYVISAMIALYCGHEGEFTERRQRPEAEKKDNNSYIVYKMETDLGLGIKTPVEIFRSSSPFEAQAFAKKRIGAFIVNEHGAMADLKIKKRGVETTVRIPADHQNTAYSPIHDKPGSRKEMFDEGYPAEMIDSQTVAEYEARQEEEDLTNVQDAWKYV
jgi:hypothetical protein